jgi:Rieske 2Fe-2S family protein
VEYTGHSLTERATTLPGRHYTSSEIFAAEQERIFSRRWLCVGRGDAIREPGDFLLVPVGAESLLLVRGREAKRGRSTTCAGTAERAFCEAERGRFAGGISVRTTPGPTGSTAPCRGAPRGRRAS